MRREFASFGGRCPYNCKFCYTFNPNYKILPDRDVKEIVISLEEKEFDLIYISGHRESFLNPNKGITLIEELFEAYNCNILFTTRNVFNSNQIERLKKINERMRNFNKYLFACVSIPALQSYKKIEDDSQIKNPYERINFLKKLYKNNIKVFLTLRPLFPNTFISINEPLAILEMCKNYVDSVISSGIIVDEFIEQRLGKMSTATKYEENPLMKCLENNYNVRYIDVSEELGILDKYCKRNRITLFSSSIPAIEYIIKNENDV